MAAKASGAALLCLILATSSLAGCGHPPSRPPMGPPNVGVVTLQAQPVTLQTELAGRTTPYAISDVRPQVNGIIKARLFTEGSNVKAGQVLYQIDPAPYRAAYDQAAAQLANAQANLVTLKLKADRYADLIKINAISRQDADDANAAYGQAVAAVAQQKAAVEAAKINLDYTKVTAPISGRIGRSAYTQGALVTAGQTDALTTVQALDPIYVDITQSSADVEKLRQSLASGGLDGSKSAPVTLKLEDGSSYPLQGHLEFTDVTVDQTTGTVDLRAVFPNPHGDLLPGMYVRAVVVQGVARGAILAPQQGIAHDEKGEPTALVVTPDGKAELRELKVDRAIGDKWLVSDGLKAGDQLIVEGTLNVQQPGMPVHAVPAGSGPPAGPGGPAAQQ
jgi:membrane fusion protein (multidrug efflux system)